MFQECLKTCQEIDEVMKENDVVFCYAENWCYAPPITKAKGLPKQRILNPDMRCGKAILDPIPNLPPSGNILEVGIDSDGSTSRRRV